MNKSGRNKKLKPKKRLVNPKKSFIYKPKIITIDLTKDKKANKHYTDISRPKRHTDKPLQSQKEMKQLNEKRK